MMDDYYTTAIPNPKHPFVTLRGQPLPRMVIFSLLRNFTSSSRTRCGAEAGRSPTLREAQLIGRERRCRPAIVQQRKKRRIWMNERMNGLNGVFLLTSSVSTFSAWRHLPGLANLAHI